MGPQVNRSSPCRGESGRDFLLDTTGHSGVPNLRPAEERAYTGWLMAWLSLPFIFYVVAAAVFLSRDLNL
jgi:hypothetical protein